MGFIGAKESRNRLVVSTVLCFFAIFAAVFVTFFYSSQVESKLRYAIGANLEVTRVVSEQKMLAQVIEKDVHNSLHGLSHEENPGTALIYGIERLKDSLRKSAELEPKFVSAGGSYQPVQQKGKDLLSSAELFVTADNESRYRLEADLDKNAAEYLVALQTDQLNRTVQADKLIKTLDSSLFISKLLIYFEIGALLLFFAFPLSLRNQKEHNDLQDERKHLQNGLEQLNQTTTELKAQSVLLEKSLDEANSQAALFEFASNRFQQLFGGLPVGCLTYAPCGTIQEWNPAMTEIFGIEGYAACLNHLSLVFTDMNVIGGVVQSVIENGERVTFEWQYPCPNGEVKDVLVVTYPLKNKKQEVLGGIMAAFNITDRKSAERALAESDERFNLAVSGSSVGLFDWNIVEGTEYWSPRFKEILGLEEDFQAHTRSLFERIHPEDQPEFDRILTAHLEGGVAFYHEFRVKHTAGHYIWVNCRGQALWNESGKPFRLAGSLDDITKRKEIEAENEQQIIEIQEMNKTLLKQRQDLQKANVKLSNMATTDGLTGLKNHKAFQSALAEYYDLAIATDSGLAVILLDVDHFKQYNDNYGHPAGDTVLKTVAMLLKKTSRSSDVVARYGGEEFVIIIQDSTPEAAMSAAERFRAALADREWPNRAVTASFGVCCLTNSETTRQDMIDHADQALYAAKHAGRNQCVRWTPELGQRAA